MPTAQGHCKSEKEKYSCSIMHERTGIFCRPVSTVICIYGMCGDFFKMHELLQFGFSILSPGFLNITA